MTEAVRQRRSPAKVRGKIEVCSEYISSLTDPFKEHLDPVLSPEEVASLEAADSAPSPPSHMPPLGLVSWRQGLPGRSPRPSYHSCSLSELHVCTHKHTPLSQFLKYPCFFRSGRNWLLTGRVASLVVGMHTGT